MRSRLPLLLLLSIGCGPLVPTVESLDTGSSEGTSESEGPPSTSTTTSPPSTTTSPPSTSTSTTDTTVTTADPDGSSGLNFLIPPDGSSGEQCMCDVFAQDCPDGEKCIAWSDDSNAWNCTRCSPIADNPGQPGDVCTVTGSPLSGLDDCDLGSMCFGVDLDTLEGTCVELCTGSEQDPICPGDTDCLIANDGVLNLCLPVCDPLADDCPPEHTCFESVHAFVCVPTGPE